MPSRWALPVAWVAYASLYLTRKNFVVAKADLGADLGLDIGALAWADTAYLTAYTVGQLVSGVLADRLGARTLLSAGMVLSAMLSAGLGVAPASSFVGLILGLQGLAQSAGWPCCVKAIGQAVAPTARGRAMGLFATSYQVGGAAATALAAGLLAWGWRASMLVPAAVVLGAAGLVRLRLPGERRGAEPDGPKTTTPGGESTGIRALLRERVVWSYGAFYFLLKLVRYGLLFWLPFYLAASGHLDGATAGLLAVPLELGGAVGAVAIGWLADRFFAHRRARLLALSAASLTGALFAYAALGDRGGVAGGLLIALVGFLIVGPEALVTGAVPQDLGGTRATAAAAGLINGIGSAGAILQGLLIAAVSARWGWSGVFWAFTALAALAAAVLAPVALRAPAAGRNGSAAP